MVITFELSTADSRGVLPKAYPTQTWFSIYKDWPSLTTALTMDPPNADLIYPAMQDRVHQPYRKTLIPGLTEILSCVTPSTYPGLLGICCQCSPTILALATENFEEISQEIINRFAKNGIKCSWKLLEPAYDGASVEQQ
ncbi:Homoserine kinase domain protein [Saccharomyces cerevisiae]|nr:Homoserine kinase domain protein [Saccharomyces cerevisiae]